MENLSRNKNLIFLFMLAIIFLMLLLILLALWCSAARVEAWTGAAEDTVNKVWTVVTGGATNLSKCWVKGAIFISHGFAGIVKSNSNALHSTWTHIVCNPSFTAVAIFLHIKCKPLTQSDRLPLIDALSRTTTQMEHWSAVSLVLGDYINTFQLAGIPLTRTQKQLQLNEANYPGKEAVVNNLVMYSDDLFESGLCMYNVTLITDRLLKVMVFNLREVDATLQTALLAQTSWWGPPRRPADQIEFSVTQLLNILDQGFVSLIAQIGVCVQSVQATDNYGHDVDHGLKMGLLSVEAQIRQGALQFFTRPDDSLVRARQLLSAALRFPIEDLLEILVTGRVELINSHAQILQVKAMMESSHKMPPVTGIKPLLETTSSSLASLSNVDALLTAGRERQKEEFRKLTGI